MCATIGLGSIFSGTIFKFFIEILSNADKTIDLNVCCDSVLFKPCLFQFTLEC